MFYKNFPKLTFLPLKILFYQSIYLSFTLSIYLSMYIVYLSIYLYLVSIYFYLIYLSFKPFSTLFILYIILFYLQLLWTIRPCSILAGSGSGAKLTRSATLVMKFTSEPGVTDHIFRNSWNSVDKVYKDDMESRKKSF